MYEQNSKKDTIILTLFLTAELEMKKPALKSPSVKIEEVSLKEPSSINLDFLNIPPVIKTRQEQLLHSKEKKKSTINAGDILQILTQYDNVDRNPAFAGQHFRQNVLPSSAIPTYRNVKKVIFKPEFYETITNIDEFVVALNENDFNSDKIIIDHGANFIKFMFEKFTTHKDIYIKTQTTRKIMTENLDESKKYSILIDDNMLQILKGAGTAGNFHMTVKNLHTTRNIVNAFEDNLNVVKVTDSELKRIHKLLSKVITPKSNTDRETIFYVDGDKNNWKDIILYLKSLIVDFLREDNEDLKEVDVRKLFDAFLKDNVINTDIGIYKFNHNNFKWVKLVEHKKFDNTLLFFNKYSNTIEEQQPMTKNNDTVSKPKFDLINDVNALTIFTVGCIKFFNDNFVNEDIFNPVSEIIKSDFVESLRIIDSYAVKQLSMLKIANPEDYPITSTFNILTDVPKNVVASIRNLLNDYPDVWGYINNFNNKGITYNEINCYYKKQVLRVGDEVTSPHEEPKTVIHEIMTKNVLIKIGE